MNKIVFAVILLFAMAGFSFAGGQVYVDPLQGPSTLPKDIKGNLVPTEPVEGIFIPRREFGSVMDTIDLSLGEIATIRDSHPSEMRIGTSATGGYPFYSFPVDNYHSPLERWLVIANIIQFKHYFTYITDNESIHGSAINGGSASATGTKSGTSTGSTLIKSHASNANSGYAYGSPIDSIIFSNVAYEVSFLVKSSTATIRLGCMDGLSSLEPSGGVFFEVNSLVLKARMGSDSYYLDSSTTYTLSTDVWYRGRMWSTSDGLYYELYRKVATEDTLVWSGSFTANQISIYAPYNPVGFGQTATLAAPVSETDLLKINYIFAMHRETF